VPERRTPTCSRHGIEKHQRKDASGKWECRECSREASRRSAEKARTAPGELVSPEVAPIVIGRDARIFRLLCDELGVKPVMRGTSDMYRLKDLHRIKAELRVRAAAWTRGERSRPY
jgi:hypothetical protein